MPLFYLTVWPWAHLFGLSPLSLRLYSSVGVCAAFVTLYLALRPRFTAAAAFLVVSLAMFSNYILIQQNAEARTYGLYPDQTRMGSRKEYDAPILNKEASNPMPLFLLQQIPETPCRAYLLGKPFGFSELLRCL
jgi:hypothetical protein